MCLNAAALLITENTHDADEAVVLRSGGGVAARTGATVQGTLVVVSDTLDAQPGVAFDVVTHIVATLANQDDSAASGVEGRRVVSSKDRL